MLTGLQLESLYIHLITLFLSTQGMIWMFPIFGRKQSCILLLVSLLALLNLALVGWFTYYPKPITALILWSLWREGISWFFIPWIEIIFVTSSAASRYFKTCKFVSATKITLSKVPLIRIFFVVRPYTATIDFMFLKSFLYLEIKYRLLE